MKYPKRNTALYKHLDQLGILESKDESIIKKAINEYYQNYDKELKKRIRKVEKRNFSVSFPSIQIQHIRKRAKEYDTSIVDYIKLIVKADISKSSPLENTLAYKEILQLLQRYKNSIDQIESKESYRFFGNGNYDALRNILESIKTEIKIK